jgi:hypothetical protein
MFVERRSIPEPTTDVGSQSNRTVVRSVDSKSQKYEGGRPSLPAALLVKALWRSDDAHHWVAARKPASNGFHHPPIVDVEGALIRAAQLSGTGFDAYLACAEFTSNRNRTAANAVGACAIWLDIDCGAAKAEDRKGYAEVWQAREALRDFVERTELPGPTHVVNSGGGLHLYWAVNRRIRRQTWQDSARKFKDLTAACGFLADPSRTADISSILRIPGTLNYKYDPPRLVRLDEAAEQPIDCDALLASIVEAHNRLCPPQAVPRSRRPTAANDRFVGRAVEQSAYGPPDLVRLAAALRLLDPDCDEYVWTLHRMAPLARAAEQYLAQAGALKRLARSWSSGALRGVPSRKWHTPGSNGQTGEQAFEKVWDRFFGESPRGYQAVSLGTIYHDASLALQVLSTVRRVA